jgi:hypothetical protein
LSIVRWFNDPKRSKSERYGLFGPLGSARGGPRETINCRIRPQVSSLGRVAVIAGADRHGRKKEPPATAAQVSAGDPAKGEETTRPYPTLYDKDISQEERRATEAEAQLDTLD